MGEGLLGEIGATQHASDFLDSCLLSEGGYGGQGARLAGLLRDRDMLVRVRGNLGEVGNAQDLTPPSQVAQRLADQRGYSSPDAGVNLVEDEGWNAGVGGGDELNAKTHPR